MKPTFKPSKIKRKRKFGFRAKNKKVLVNKRKKGRYKLSV